MTVLNGRRWASKEKAVSPTACRDPPPGSAPIEVERYEQELSRQLGMLGSIALTLSSVTPASSVFIIVPFIILTAGTGSFLAMVLAAVIGVFMAYCWAELSAAFLIAGGDYALIGTRSRFAPLAGPVSFSCAICASIAHSRGDRPAPPST
jgi:hypothetical protein